MLIKRVGIENHQSLRHSVVMVQGTQGAGKGGLTPPLGARYQCHGRMEEHQGED